MTYGRPFCIVLLGLSLLLFAAAEAAAASTIEQRHVTPDSVMTGRSATGSSYLGTVRSIPIPLGYGGTTFWGPLAFDTKRNAIDIAYYDTYANALLMRVQMNGATSEIAALPNMPTGLVYDPVNDTLYSTDQSHYTVYSISQHGLVLPLAGGSSGTNDGQGRNAQFQGPQGITVDPANGVLFVADVDRVRRITRNGYVKTISPPGGFGPLSQYQSSYIPEGIAFDALDRTLFVTDSYQQKVWHVFANTTKTVTGQCINFSCDALQRNGPLNYALLGGPDGIVFDPVAKALYVVEFLNCQVRRIDAHGVTTLSGSGSAGFKDGLSYAARFNFPSQGVLNPKTGDLIVLDTQNNDFRFVKTVGQPPPPPAHGISMFDPPTPESRPSALALAPDGSTWFTEVAYNKIGWRAPNGTITEYPGATGTSAFGRIVLGGDGNMWFAANGPNGAEIDRITPGGTISEFPVYPPASYYQVQDLILGSDGNIWFSENYGSIGVMTPTGSYSIYSNFNAQYIANGLGGTYWLSNYGSLEQISSAPALLRQINLPIAAGYLTLGPDNNIWVAQPGGLLKVTSRAVLKYLLPAGPNGTTYVGDLAIGADHHIWFTESTASIGRMTTAGNYRNFIVPAPRSSPAGIVAAPDGSIWFVDPGSNKIGRYQ